MSDTHANSAATYAPGARSPQAYGYGPGAAGGRGRGGGQRGGGTTGTVRGLLPSGVYPGQKVQLHVPGVGPAMVTVPASAQPGLYFFLPKKRGVLFVVSLCSQKSFILEVSLHGEYTRALTFEVFFFVCQANTSTSRIHSPPRLSMPEGGAREWGLGGGSWGGVKEQVKYSRRS